MDIPTNRDTRPAEDDGLLFGCRLNGDGTGDLVGWKYLENWHDESGPAIWIHLDRDSAHVHEWLNNASGLTTPTTDALLAEETRPRVFHGRRGYITIVRGINTNPNADAENMIAMRMWSDGHHVITIRQERLMTPRDVLAELVDTGTGPKNASELYERLIHRITERMADAVGTFEGELDEIEDSLDLSLANEHRNRLLELRRKTARLRRYISPQKEALNTLLVEPPNWFQDESKMRLRETIDRLFRYTEEIDTARERASVIREDIANQIAEASNKTLYVLAIVSAVFLPLGFLTGLLGINVGGVPGTTNANAFWIFCVVMVVLLAIELYVFKRLKWL